MSIFSDIQDAISKLEVPAKPPFSNVLHSYATYNYIFTMSILDKTRIGVPARTYKKGDIGQIIFKSASGDPKNRVPIGKYGSFDFFIDDVNITSQMGLDLVSGNTNSSIITFKITEPYSMGMFLHALEVGAKQMGYENYASAPILLTIEFIGNLNPSEYGVSSEQLTKIEKTTRHIPIKIMKAEMSVTHAGSIYDVTACAWNDAAQSTTYMTAQSDLSITGSTVQELLQSGENSLEAVLNKRWMDEAVKAKKDPDQLLILFPKDPKTDSGVTSVFKSFSATIDPNSMNNIVTLRDVLNVKPVTLADVEVLVQDTNNVNAFGTASMNFNVYDGVSTPFAENSVVYDDKTKTYTRGNLTIKANKGNTVGDMKFSQGADIRAIINEVILMSDYGQKVLKKEEVEKQKGKISWWRLDFQSYPIDSDKNKYATGDAPKLVVVRVVPYTVSSAVFLPSNKADPYIKDRLKEAIKSYDYIYTGKNYDIISFDINFKYAVYQGLFDVKNTGDQKLKEQQAPLAEPEKPKSQESGYLSSLLYNIEELVDDVNPFKKRVKTDVTSTSSSLKGGSLADTEATKIAKHAHDLILSGVHLMTATVKIIGDPYFLGDSGLGNYTAPETQYSNLNADGCINYQNGEVDIALNFKTPIDIDPAIGTYEFGGLELVSSFSGLYRVLKCENNFSKGKFTQELTLSRCIGQDPVTGQLAGLKPTN